MIFTKNILLILQSEMETPQPYGWFHLLWIVITVISTVILCIGKTTETKTRVILFAYGFVALVLEITKQIIWTYTYNSNGLYTADYQWYAAPFQFCSTPMYVAIICALIKNGKMRNSLMSYLSFVTIVGGIMTIIIPSSCFTSMIEVNIHTMFLHCGGVVVSLYLLITKTIKPTYQNLYSAIATFAVFVAIALTMNIVIYHSGWLNGETFNMFYISPYFISVLPVFDTIQQNTPYIIFLLSYITAITTSAHIVCGTTKLLQTIPGTFKKSINFNTKT